MGGGEGGAVLSLSLAVRCGPNIHAAFGFPCSTRVLRHITIRVSGRPTKASLTLVGVENAALAAAEVVRKEGDPNDATHNTKSSPTHTHTHTKQPQPSLSSSFFFFNNTTSQFDRISHDRKT